MHRYYCDQAWLAVKWPNCKYIKNEAVFGRCFFSFVLLYVMVLYNLLCCSCCYIVIIVIAVILLVWYQQQHLAWWNTAQYSSQRLSWLSWVELQNGCSSVIILLLCNQCWVCCLRNRPKEAQDISLVSYRPTILHYRTEDHTIVFRLSLVEWSA